MGSFSWSSTLYAERGQLSGLWDRGFRGSRPNLLLRHRLSFRESLLVVLAKTAAEFVTDFQLDPPGPHLLNLCSSLQLRLSWEEPWKSLEGMHQPLKDRDCRRSCFGRRDLRPGQVVEGREQPGSLVSREQRDDFITPAARMRSLPALLPVAGREEGCSGLPALPGSAMCVTHPFVNTRFWHSSFSFD